MWVSGQVGRLAIGRVVVAGADGSNPAFVAPGLGYTYMARLGPKNGIPIGAAGGLKGDGNIGSVPGPEK